MLHRSDLKNHTSISKKYRQVLSPAPFYIPWFLFEHQLWGHQEEVHPQPLHFCHLIEEKLVKQGKKNVLSIQNLNFIHQPLDSKLLVAS